MYCIMLLVHGRSINMEKIQGGSLHSHPIRVGLRQIMLRWCVCRCRRGQVVHRHHSNLAYSISTPLTRHSCIAKHHLVLFCLQQSQLTKNDNNSCCKTKAKQRGEGKVRMKSSAAKKLREVRNGKGAVQTGNPHWKEPAQDFWLNLRYLIHLSC